MTFLFFLRSHQNLQKVAVLRRDDLFFILGDRYFGGLALATAFSHRMQDNFETFSALTQWTKT